jgi:hypothetical protein
MERVLNTPVDTNACAKYLRVSRQACDIIPLFAGDLFTGPADGFNQIDGFNGVLGRMSNSQPGNIISYSVIPPLLPAMIDLKGTAGLFTRGAGWAKSVPSKQIFTSS